MSEVIPDRANLRRLMAEAKGRIFDPETQPALVALAKEVGPLLDALDAVERERDEVRLRRTWPLSAEGETVMPHDCDQPDGGKCQICIDAEKNAMSPADMCLRLAELEIDLARVTAERDDAERRIRLHIRDLSGQRDAAVDALRTIARAEAAEARCAKLERVAEAAGPALYLGGLATGSRERESLKVALADLSAPATDNTSAPPGLTHEEIAVACKNIGYGLDCGACAELFFTGVRLHDCDPGCANKFDRTPPVVTIEPGTSTAPVEKWVPPFGATGIGELECPGCNVHSVMVREQGTYTEGGVEAYCANCHRMLEVQVNVEITFSDPEVA